MQWVKKAENGSKELRIQCTRTLQSRFASTDIRVPCRERCGASRTGQGTRSTSVARARALLLLLLLLLLPRVFLKVVATFVFFAAHCRRWQGVGVLPLDFGLAYPTSSSSSSSVHCCSLCSRRLNSFQERLEVDAPNHGVALEGGIRHLKLAVIPTQWPGRGQSSTSAAAFLSRSRSRCR